MKSHHLNFETWLLRLTAILPLQPLLIFSSLHHLWGKTWGTVISVLSHLALTMSYSLDNSTLGFHHLISQILLCFPCSTLELSLLTLISPHPILYLLSWFSKLLSSPLLPNFLQSSQAAPVPGVPSPGDGAEGAEANRSLLCFQSPHQRLSLCGAGLLGWPQLRARHLSRLHSHLQDPLQRCH